MKPPIITLLTDFGTADYFVGAMKGVILSLCPNAQIVDITHEIAPFQVAYGGYTLGQAWRCFPAGTIHVAVVDPGVGSSRRPILVEAGGHLFVAPDNGVLTQVCAATSPDAVRVITASRYFRHPVSSTFHGRDIFAPVAAHLAAGVSPSLMGALSPEITLLPLPEPVQLDVNSWQGQILWVDRFGNLVTCFDVERFGWVATRPFRLEIEGHTVDQYARYYSEMEGSGLYLAGGSAGHLEVSMNQQHAARFLAVASGSAAILRKL